MIDSFFYAAVILLGWLLVTMIMLSKKMKDLKFELDCRMAEHYREFDEKHDKMLYEIEKHLAKLKVDAPRCDKAPEGWFCTREIGHEGPCAAKIKEESSDEDNRWEEIE